MASGCLILFYKNYNFYRVLYILASIITVIGSITSPSFVALHLLVSEIGLRVFIVILQELQCLPNCLHVSIIRVMSSCHFTKCRCSTPSIFNVLPEGVYCCFTR